MKKKSNLCFLSLFFITAILVEIYCLLELRNDFFCVVGGGIVVLISAYLLEDALMKELASVQERYSKVEEEQRKRYEDIIERLDTFEKFEKSNYIRLKNINISIENGIEKIENLNNDNIKLLIENQNKTNKLAIKYQKKHIEESTGQICALIQQVKAEMNINSVDLANEEDVILAAATQEMEEPILEEKDSTIELQQGMDTNKQLTPEEIASLFASLG